MTYARAFEIGVTVVILACLLAVLLWHWGWL